MRLTELEHHVVGDVDHRADRAQARAPQPLAQPRAGWRACCRRRAARRASSRPAPAPRRQCQRQRRDRALACVRARGVAALRPNAGVLSAAPLSAATSRAMPSTDMRVAAIGRHVDFEHRIVEIQVRARRSAPSGASAGSSRMPSAASRPGPARAPSTACPAIRRRAACARLDAHIARQHRAHGGQRADQPGARIGRAADDLQRRARPRPRPMLVTRHTRSFSACGCALGADDARHHDAAEWRRGRGSMAFDLEAGHGQPAGELARVPAAASRPSRAATTAAVS